MPSRSTISPPLLNPLKIPVTTGALPKSVCSKSVADTGKGVGPPDVVTTTAAVADNVDVTVYAKNTAVSLNNNDVFICVNC